MKKSLKSRIQKLLFGHHDDEGRSATEADIIAEIKALISRNNRLKEKLNGVDPIRFLISGKDIYQDALRLEQENTSLCDQLGASRTNEACLQSEISKLQVQVEALRKV